MSIQQKDKLQEYKIDNIIRMLKSQELVNDFKRKPFIPLFLTGELLVKPEKSLITYP